MHELAVHHTWHPGDPCSIPSDGEIGSGYVVDLAVWVLAATLSVADSYRRGEHRQTQHMGYALSRHYTNCRGLPKVTL